ncbi:Ig-like domain repeat protein, partial [Falsiroseomonas stagni]
MSFSGPTTTISGIDISQDSGSSAADFVTKNAIQNVTATLSAALVSGEALEASVDGGLNWTDISSSVFAGTSVAWSSVTLAGNSSLQFRVVSGGLSGPVSSQAYVVDTVAPTTTVLGVDISADTGSSASDFLTKTASQTVTATLSAPLAAGEILEASVDNGTTWTTITGSVVGTSVSWSGAALLSGTNSLRLRVTDAAGNTGTESVRPYELDTVAPGTTVSSISISDDTGVSSSDLVTKTASQTITTTLSSGLAGGEILELSVDGGASWSDISASVTGTSVSAAAQLIGGTSSIQMRVTDAAGNYGPAQGLGYTLLTVAPDVTVSAIDISADTGTSDSDFNTNNSSQTISATLSSTLGVDQILLGSVDGGVSWGSLNGAVSGTTLNWSVSLRPGSNDILLRVEDFAGNSGPVASRSYVLDTVAPLTSAASIDISDDTGASPSDFRTNESAQTVTATLSTALASGEILEGSTDGGATWTDITGSVTGTAVNWVGATLSGASAIQFQVKDLAGNIGSLSSQAYVLDTASTTISGIGISADTGGSASDFITKTASQTITATLGSALEAGEILEGSVDGGASWIDITSSVSGTSVTWVGATLAGSSSIKLRTTDVAGNTSVDTQNYVLDTSPATTTASSIDISSDTGISSNDFVTKDAAQTITATLSSALVAGEALYGSVDGGATWTDITGSVTGTAVSWSGPNATLVGSDSIVLRVTDAAGNNGVLSSQNYVLDQTGTGVSAIDISDDTGSSDSDFITSAGSQTITATLGATLDTGDLVEGSIDNGATWTDITSSVTGTTVTWAGQTLTGSNTIQIKVTDAAGNVGTIASQAYVIDTTAATTTVSAIGLSSDTGALTTDLVTNDAGPQTINATLSAALTTGEVLEGSLDGGVTWADVTFAATGTVIAWSGVALSAGVNDIRLRVTDAAGNVGIPSIQAYELDQTAPLTAVSITSISNDSGTSSSDFLTKTPFQIVNVAFSAPLAVGEYVEASVDGGVTWAAQGGVAGTSTHSFGVTLPGAFGTVASSSIQVRVTDVAGNGGTAGIQNYVLDQLDPVTTASNIDISSDTGVSSSDFETKQATQTITATLTTPLDPGDILQGSVDGGVNWTDITNQISGTIVTWTGATLSGSSSIELRVVDAAGNIGTVSAQSYVLDTVGATTVSGIGLSSDTGSSASDLITNVAAQTVTATLSSPLLAGEILEGSVDGGATWTTISGGVGSTAVNWTGVTLSGSSSIQLRVTDVAGNVGVAGTAAYVLDTTAATTTVSQIDISADAGTLATDFLTNVATQDITATLSTALLAGEVLEGSVDGGLTWTDITTSVSGTAVNWVGATLLSGVQSVTSSSIHMRVLDAAGNAGISSTQAYVLDTQFTTISGIAISSDTGTSATDDITKDALQTVTATLSAPLLPGEVLELSVDGGVSWANVAPSSVTGTAVSAPAVLASGSNSVQLRLTPDAAGNRGFASLAYELDTTPPATTLSGIDISSDTGTSASDFVTNVAAQTVTATLSSALATGEVLQGSVDGGATWSDITPSATGTAVSWTGLTLAGSSSVQLRVMDAAGNTGSVASEAYVLDTTAPTTTLSAIDIASDSGASATDFVTNVASQTVTATLSSALATGDILEGSVDGGASWSDITGSVSGTAVSWATATLAGSSSIQLRVTDAAGNTGSAASQAYVLDTTAPGVSGIDISSDSGTLATDFLTNVASQIVTATLNAALAAGEVLEGSVDGGTTWTNITGSVSGTAVTWSGVTLSGSSTIQLRVTDEAGNVGSTSQAYVVDTVAPTKTLSGFDISADTGTFATDFVTNAASQTVTATLSSALATGEILQGSVDGGTSWSDITSAASGTAVSWTGATLAGSSSIQVRVMDAAGNAGAAFGQVYELDTVAPATTFSGFDISADTGTSAGDFVTKAASQTVTATLSSALAAGDILQGSVDGGATWSDITSAASGTAVSWAGATLAGSSSIQLRVMDVAGNAGAAFDQAYVLDTVAPTTTLSGLAIGTDTGTSTSDRLTKVASQTVTATLSSALAS